MVVLHYDAWWMTAAAAVVLSQALVVLYWQDAKFGTIANIVVLCGAVIGFGIWSFNAGSRVELALFSVPAAAERKVLTREAVAGLPPAVRTWLERSGAVGREAARSVRLKQKGMMRTAPDGNVDARDRGPADTDRQSRLHLAGGGKRRAGDIPFSPGHLSRGEGTHVHQGAFPVPGR